ncbi:hypothetical protein PVL29_023005 [Vitis rotundifolia]|uniref:Uncharacterized protein n=1 Tax=Vitis rotundifolia TaxID=103349 RepID=A0AA38YX11_VITRO|nr:hypothetical protein PVL29_023005 [Vitis rotundifolia]
MKTTSLPLFSLLLIALAFNPCPWVAEAASDPVLDIEGKELQSGVDYYILSVIHGRGGGLTMASVRNEICPLDVVQGEPEVSNGLPVMFTPVNPKEGVICVSTDHNIKFSAATICVQSTVWKLEYDESTGQWFITTGGDEGNPGHGTLSNWFKIEKCEENYKLVFCPTVCDFCKPVCGDIGIYIQDGHRRLALSDMPFKVMFHKA